MNFNIIVSIGPSLTGNPEKLRKIDSYGDCIYRINGAHVDISAIPAEVQNLRALLPDAKIMLDLPGNKIRLKGLVEPICLAKGEIFELHDYQVNFLGFHKFLKTGNKILTNDSTCILEVKEVNGSIIRLLSHSDGLLHNRRGLYVKGVNENLPFFFKKDLELIDMAFKENLDFISLSFVRNASDIHEFKKILGKHPESKIKVISKIETASAVENLEEILNEVDFINIDRGDLSADIGLENLPLTQEKVIASVKKAGKKFFLATQFLKSMEKNPIPLIAELSDLHHSIRAGISGIQLSEETAIGKYPEKCVKLVSEVFKKYAP